MTISTSLSNYISIFKVCIFSCRLAACSCFFFTSGSSRHHKFLSRHLHHIWTCASRVPFLFFYHHPAAQTVAHPYSFFLFNLRVSSVNVFSIHPHSSQLSQLLGTIRSQSFTRRLTLDDLCRRPDPGLRASLGAAVRLYSRITEPPRPPGLFVGTSCSTIQNIFCHRSIYGINPYYQICWKESGPCGCLPTTRKLYLQLHLARL